MNDAFPLLVCVTGHRDLPPDQHDRICREVQAVLRQLRRDLPHTPLAILSPIINRDQRIGGSRRTGIEGRTPGAIRGREALAENADWVVQHRQRPPVLPAG